MKKNLKNIAAFVFLIMFLPYTMLLLVNGREGIHQEKSMSELEYQVLYELMREDYSWMDDRTLELMAILCRTDCVRKQIEPEAEFPASELFGETYGRVYRAVQSTKGQVIVINGSYRELPYHAVSAGVTRDGVLLGDEYAYVLSVECPKDREADSYLQICYLTKEELREALGPDMDISWEDLVLERDHEEYVTRVSSPEKSWTGENFRSLLHLSSSCFWIEEGSDDSIRIMSKGNGHGFGISLYTADRMIQEGETVSGVIQKFYENAECITVP